MSDKRLDQICSKLASVSLIIPQRGSLPIVSPDDSFLELCYIQSSELGPVQEAILTLPIAMPGLSPLNLLLNSICSLS